MYSMLVFSVRTYLWTLFGTRPWLKGNKKSKSVLSAPSLLFLSIKTIHKVWNHQNKYKKILLLYHDSGKLDRPSKYHNNIIKKMMTQHLWQLDWWIWSDRDTSPACKATEEVCQVGVETIELICILSIEKILSAAIRHCQTQLSRVCTSNAYRQHCHTWGKEFLQC